MAANASSPATLQAPGQMAQKANCEEADAEAEKTDKNLEERKDEDEQIIIECSHEHRRPDPKTRVLEIVAREPPGKIKPGPGQGADVQQLSTDMRKSQMHFKPEKIRLKSTYDRPVDWEWYPVPSGLILYTDGKNPDKVEKRRTASASEAILFEIKPHWMKRWRVLSLIGKGLNEWKIHAKPENLGEQVYTIVEYPGDTFAVYLRYKRPTHHGDKKGGHGAAQVEEHARKLGGQEHASTPKPGSALQPYVLGEAPASVLDNLELSYAWLPEEPLAIKGGLVKGIERLADYMNGVEKVIHTISAPQGGEAKKPQIHFFPFVQASIHAGFYEHTDHRVYLSIGAKAFVEILGGEFEVLFGPMAYIPAFIRKHLDDYVKIGLYLRIFGAVGFELEWVQTGPDKGDSKKAAVLHGDIGVKIGAELVFWKKDVLHVDIGGGATMRVMTEVAHAHHEFEMEFKVVWFGLIVEVLIEVPWVPTYHDTWKVADGGTLVEKKWPEHHGKEEEHAGGHGSE